MTATYEHPSLTMHVTPEQRERAEHWLQEAYADGRITEDEFDRRIGQVISSTTRRELNTAFYGLVNIPMPSQTVAMHAGYRQVAQAGPQHPIGSGQAAFAHFSALFSWFLGPALVFALSPQGSYARREAAKAFNFQIVTVISLIVVGIVAGVTSSEVLGALVPMIFVSWFVFNIVGGVKALRGEDWRNPVKSVLRLQVLPEK
jgi:uncharacterized Tic20 family protein